MDVRILAGTIMMISACIMPLAIIGGIYTAIRGLKRDKDNSEQLLNNQNATLLTFFLASNRGKNVDTSTFNQQNNGFVDYANANNDFYDPNMNHNKTNNQMPLLNNNIANVKNNSKGYFKAFLTGIGFSIISFILLYIFIV